MKVQVDWLKEYTEIDVPTDELGHVLTMAGLEIESHETVELPDGEKSEVLELNVTPNRGYCLSHIGVAREVSALLNKSLKLPDPLWRPYGEWLRWRSAYQLKTWSRNYAPVIVLW